jgi:hypothetical protein
MRHPGEPYGTRTAPSPTKITGLGKLHPPYFGSAPRPTGAKIAIFEAVNRLGDARIKRCSFLSIRKVDTHVRTAINSRQSLSCDSMQLSR